MAGTLIVSNLKTDTDNTFIVRSNTGTTLFSANTSGIDIANSIGATAITNDKILSVANTKISGNIISSQITSVANTQLTGTITGSQISSNTLSNTVFQTGSVENYMNAAGLGFGMRNRIINGAMVIDQRNAGASVTPASGAFTLDRWNATTVGGTSKFSVQQNAGGITPPAGFINYLGITSLSAYSITAGDLQLITQAIEGFNVADLGWGAAGAATVTLSFWVRSSLTGTFGGSLRNFDNNRSYPFSYSIPTANTWTQISVTVAGDTSGTWYKNNSTGIYVSWGLGVGSTYSGTANAWGGALYGAPTGSVSVVGTNGATFYITGVQLEKGSTATSFDYRPYSSEFSMCQRYFQKCDSFTGIAQTATNYVGLFTLQQTMRTTPSIGQTGVVYIAEYVASDLVQSSASASIISTGGGGTALVCYLFNYSGMTVGQFRASRMLNSNTVTFSAEL